VRKVLEKNFRNFSQSKPPWDELLQISKSYLDQGSLEEIRKLKLQTCRAQHRCRLKHISSTHTWTSGEKID
jgi:hypothetical protein